MRYFLDCEFDGRDGPLISIAMVSEHPSMPCLYLINKFYHEIVQGERSTDEVRDPWVRDNVIPIVTELLTRDKMVSPILPENAFSTVIRLYLQDDHHPSIVSDSPVDIYRFCQIYTSKPDGTWWSSDKKRMDFHVENVDCYPTSCPGAVYQHNALSDALALRHKILGI